MRRPALPAHRRPAKAPSRRALIALALVAALALAAGAVALVATTGRLARHQTVFGRVLRPHAALVRLGHFPTGGALTPDGRFYWTVSTGRALNDIRIVSLAGAHPRVIQVLPLPGASGGIAMDPAHNLAYVSGVPDSTNLDEQRPGLPGREGDVIHVFSYTASGRATETGTIPVPPPATATAPQAFPPVSGPMESWPDRLAISRDGSTLLVPLNLGDAAAVVDTGTHAVRYVPTGHYPYGGAILPGGHVGLVSNETDGTVSVVDLQSATKVKDIQVGAHLSHPEAIALDPSGRRAYVAVANADQVAVIDTTRMAVERTISVERPEGLGASPVALTVTPNGRGLVVAEAGADELALVSLSTARPIVRSATSRVAGVARREAAWQVVGRIPTAEYPADVQVTSGRNPKLVWVAGKGFGSGPNPRGPDPYTTNDANLLQHPGTAVLTDGYAGVQRFPADQDLAGLTRLAGRDIRPSNLSRPPRGTSLRAHGPIKHVFYIVRENRTYDQVLGDVRRGDGDAALTLFGQRVTPNIHALASRFPLLDHVYADSEASIDGHFWTAAAKVSDYVQKNWQQNYAGRGRPYDFGIYSVTWPGNGFLFDQAERQKISYFNYGEAVAGAIPLFPDKDRTPSDLAAVNRKFAKSDLGAPFGCYPNDAYIGKNSISGNDVYDSSVPSGAKPGSESRFDCFKQKFEAQVNAGKLPAFNYMVLSNDHTEGTTPGRRTPRAMVAENDYGLGQIVDLISHSKVWRSSAIFVIEDDSQDGSDHVDAHRMPAAVISPFARRGAVIHTRYDMLSVIRSMELILGMKPLGLFDRLATPMYDAFSSGPANAAPYAVIAPTYPLNERNATTAANARLSKSLRINHPDRVPQRLLDRILWQSVHGARSEPPPPGPNAEPGG